VRDVVEELLERFHVDVGLRQTKAQGKDGVGGMAAHMRPPTGKVVALRMLNRGRERLRCGKGNQDKGEDSEGQHFSGSFQGAIVSFYMRRC
jgi:hypothetical protein